MSPSDADRRSALRGKFRAVALERLQRLFAAVDPLTAHPPPTAMLDETLREIHTLKGESRMLGIAAINDVAHATEDVLIRLKTRTAGLTSAERDVVMLGLDLCGALLQEEDFGPGPWTADVAQFVRDAARTPAAESPSSGPRSAEPIQAASTDVGGRGVAADDHLSVNEEHEQPRPDKATDAVEWSIASPRSGTRGTTPRPSVRESVRISSDALETLTDLAGTLALRHEETDRHISDVARIQRDLLRIVGHLHSGKAASHKHTDPRDALVPLLKELGSTVGRVRDRSFETSTRLTDLQETVRKLRLLKLATVLEHIPSAVRALGREQKKRVRVDMDAGDVALDTQVLDVIDQVLVHLVRNAVDHGIETPEVRAARGKPIDGTVRIAARALGTRVELIVEDDGSGVDVEHLRELVVRRGIMDQPAAHAAGVEQLLEVLFLPGFSTRADTSDVSGRGVGLDAVRAAIEGCGGTLHLENAPRCGTVFRLEVPVSVALSRAVVVHLRKGVFALPCASVAAVVSVTRASVHFENDRPMLMTGGELLPLSDLGAVLDGIPSPMPDEGSRAVVVEHHGNRHAFAVGRILGERELFARALDPLLAGIRLVAATAMIEEGRLVQLLNVASVMAHAESAIFRNDSAGEEQHARVTRPRVLVVEDSALTRDMLIDLARQWGVDVLEAPDGFEALRMLERDRPNLVITDLDMPILDGIAMIERMRALPALAHVPVVVLSTRTTNDDMQRAFQAGANAYLTKAAFRPDDLRRVFDFYLSANEREVVDARTPEASPRPMPSASRAES